MSMQSYKCWHCGAWQEFYQVRHIVPDCRHCGAGQNGTLAPGCTHARHTDCVKAKAATPPNP
jgi:methionyl-tRNA synthetase